MSLGDRVPRGRSCWSDAMSSSSPRCGGPGISGPLGRGGVWRSASGGGFARRGGIDAAEDRMGDVGLRDGGDDATATATAITEEDVNGEDLLQELGPCSAIRRGSRRTLAPFGLQRGEQSLARDNGRAITRCRVKDRPVLGDGGWRRGGGANSAATASVGGKDAMVAREMDEAVGRVRTGRRGTRGVT